MVTVENVGDAPTAGYCLVEIHTGGPKSIAEFRFEVPLLDSKETTEVSSELPKYEEERVIFSFACVPGPSK